MDGLSPFQMIIRDWAKHSGRVWGIQILTVDNPNGDRHPRVVYDGRSDRPAKPDAPLDQEGIVAPQRSVLDLSDEQLIELMDGKK